MKGRERPSVSEFPGGQAITNETSVKRSDQSMMIIGVSYFIPDVEA